MGGVGGGVERVRGEWGNKSIDQARRSCDALAGLERSMISLAELASCDMISKPCKKKKSPNNPEAPPIEERRRVCGNQRPLADTLSSRTPKPKESSSMDGSLGPSSRTAGLHMFPCLRQLPLELRDLGLPLAETPTLLEMIPLPRVQVL